MENTTSNAATAATFLDSPEQRRSKKKWLLILIPVAFLFLLLLFEGTHGNAHIANPIHPNYVKAFCPARTLFDYRNENPQSITITLQEGCYHGEYILPLAWDRYFVQKSTAPGDYATVWCNGSNNPGEIRKSYEDMGGTMNPCRDHDEVVPHFSIEGKGTMILTRTREHKIWTPFNP